ncbi:MAG: glycosyltransferase [Proteobacteria bacterium]|nr:glycosyltransferase [Pseudomonadota bacterium]
MVEKKMIRVLHAIDTTGPGGAETVFVTLAGKLDPSEYKSFAAIHGPGWVADSLGANGIEPIFIQSKGTFNFAYLWNLITLIRKHKIDIVLSHLLGSNLYCSIAGLLCRIPVLSIFHGFVDSSENERAMQIKVNAINIGSKKIVFVSDMLGKEFIGRFGFSSRKSVTVYNGVETSVFKPQRDETLRAELGILPDHILIGAVGNIRPAKDYHTFLKAARQVYDKNSKCRFVIVGQGRGALYQSLLNLRADLGLADICFFTGFRDQASVLYNNFDVFLSTSISEGFSISTIEALACGLPVVATRSGGPDEIIRLSGCGVLCDHDVQSIAESVLKTIETQDQSADSASIRNRCVENLFSTRVMLQKYESLIIEACSKKHKIEKQKF